MTTFTKDEILEARRVAALPDEQAEWTWTGLTTRCRLCDAKVEVTLDELSLVDGSAPTSTVCADCSVD